MGVINSQFESELIDSRNVLFNVPCNSSVFVGAAVRMSSGAAINAIADSIANSNVIGVVEAKASLNQCDIRVGGVTTGNIFSGLDETKEYFLSDSIAGDLTTIPPLASTHIILRVGQPYDDQNLLVIKGTRIIRL